MVQWKHILVGVDGSESSLKALEWARDVAIGNGAELTVLMAWHVTVPPVGGPSATYSTHDDAPAESPSRERLMQAIHQVLGEDPPVLVHPVLRQGGAAKELIDASVGQDLLVVGSRGHGGFVGLLLGSVSQHVAAHAACSVVVVR